MDQPRSFLRKTGDFVVNVLCFGVGSIAGFFLGLVLAGVGAHFIGPNTTVPTAEHPATPLKLTIGLSIIILGNLVGILLWKKMRMPKGLPAGLMISATFMGMFIALGLSPDN